MIVFDRNHREFRSDLGATVSFYHEATYEPTVFKHVGMIQESQDGESLLVFYKVDGDNKMTRVPLQSLTMYTFQENMDSEWYEAHHEIACEIDKRVENYDSQPTGFQEYYDDKGKGGMWVLAKKLTDEFCLLHENRDWEGEFFKELDRFLEQKIQAL